MDMLDLCARRLLVAAAAAILCACGGGSGVVSIEVGGQGPDASSDGPVIPPVIEVLEETALADLDDAGNGDWAPFDGAPTCEPGTGCFLDPCESGEDCLSGLCLGHMGNMVCSIDCIEECPEGWECRQIGTGPDIVFACVSPYTHLCRPCATSSDCKAATGVEDVCLSFESAGAFCGADCSATQVCPEDYQCTSATTVEGGKVTQCLPLSGECKCSAQAIALGLSTPCYLENEWGRCDGLRVCSENGLGDCNAALPEEEICDGVDNDCNGKVDDVSCDDGDACTSDLCDPASGCVHNVLTGTDCNDNDVCTLADHCEDGTCIGTLINCDDGNPCTSDSCDPGGGCVYGFNNAPCDDNDPCTVNDTCAQGNCSGFPVPCECQVDSDCIQFENGDLCDGTLTCDTSQFPQVCAVIQESVIDCPEPDGADADCLEAHCHPLTAECSFLPANEGKACSDLDACTISDACLEGTCLPGPAANCNDGNPCTDDGCDSESGCFNDPNLAPCNDGNVCTVDDQCALGSCVAGSVLSCDDGNSCTDDSCDLVAGCVHAAKEGPCDDGNLCTTGDHCVDGACLFDAMQQCNDANPCTDDSCLPETGCIHHFNSISCNDDNACTTGDKCTGGVCAGPGSLNCDDANPCTDDSCDLVAGCLHTVNQAPCNDGNPCTIGDACFNGLCQGNQGLDCGDGNPCTDDSCDPATGCTHAHNNSPCNDGNLCTTQDLCKQGLCAGATPPDCNDGNPCTNDVCQPDTGCTHEPNAAPCNDNNECTVDDKCVGGLCQGTGSLECDDLNPCTKDLCLPDGGCQHQDTDGPCSDADSCTLSDSCVDGECAPGTPLDCDDGNPCTDDACSQGECLHLPNDAACDDGNACTTGESCLEGLCAPAGTPDCDDANVCTTDFCDPQNGCTHVHNTVPCNDGNVCTLYDVCGTGACAGTGLLDCYDGNACTSDTCNPDSGCEHAPDEGECDDSNPCTAQDTCVNGLCLGLAWTDCDDENLCTDDSCIPGQGCVHEDNDNPCNDEDPCTLLDLCLEGVCAGSGELPCDDSNNCTDDSCLPGEGCLHDPVAPCCGNGIQEEGEECDDGNNAGADGCSAACAVEAQPSCQTLHQVSPALPSGIRTIDPDGDGGGASFEVYCDMTTAGGGWTLAAKFSNKDAKQWIDAKSRWTSNSTFGDATTLAEDHDAKSPAWGAVQADEFLFTDTYQPGHYMQTTGNCIGGVTLTTFFTLYLDNYPDKGSLNYKKMCSVTKTYPLAPHWMAEPDWSQPADSANLGPNQGRILFGNTDSTDTAGVISGYDAGFTEADVGLGPNEGLNNSGPCANAFCTEGFGQDLGGPTSCNYNDSQCQSEYPETVYLWIR